MTTLRRTWPMLLFAAATLAAPLPAQELGRIHFPTSAGAAARPHFEQGVLLLHSFEYGRAAAAFRRAQEAEPAFAMAYWGEALTYTHPLWNEQDQAAGSAALARLGPTREARLAKAPTARERQYLGAVELLYGEGTKARRDTLYAEAMADLARAYPEDDEAKVFHAVALLGLNQGVRDVPTYMRAGAIAGDVFRRNPDHPGAAHFVIHAFDDPIHAPLGLHAARRYSEIAPEAPHAQHMTTHIFLALGMWDEVVSQNEIAAGPERARWRAGHYTAWLGYGLLQQGRMADARRLLELVRDNLSTPPRGGERSYLLGMRAHYLVASERWNDPAASWLFSVEGTGPVVRAMDAFALGYAALRRGDRAAAQASVERLATITGGGRQDSYAGNEAVPVVLRLSLQAALLADAGRADSAVALLREANRLEDAMPLEFGPPDVVKSSHEILGEILLAQGKAAEARRAFERALALTPGRSLALLGHGRAARAEGETTAAARSFAQLARNWARADADLPALGEVRRAVSAASGAGQ